MEAWAAVEGERGQACAGERGLVQVLAVVRVQGSQRGRVLQQGH